jgi:transposase-like protein
MRTIKKQIKNLESLLECATFAEDIETILYCESEIEKLNKKLKERKKTKHHVFVTIGELVDFKKLKTF